MLKSSLFDYSDAYILVKRTITVNNTAAADADANNANKKVIFKNCALFTDCKSEINNVEIDNAKGINIIMLMYTLIEYSDNYWKQSGSLCQYWQDTPAVNNNGTIVDFGEGNLTDSFDFKEKNKRSIWKWWKKRCWNNGTIKKLRQVFENSCNSFH